MKQTELELTDKVHDSSVTIIRRREANLPSVRRHVFNALIITAMTGIGVIAGFKLFGNPIDALALGEVGIEPAPMPAAADSLNGTGEALPDLLGAAVPKGSNPTAAIDALGNPIGGQNANQLAGANQPAPTPEPVQPAERIASVQIGTPRTIMIDGKPIASGAFPTAALPRAPFDDISRRGPYGIIPTISSTGNKAVTSYARSYTPTPGTNPVAIVIGGLGIDRNLTRRIINETPAEVTLAFAAHTNGLQTWIHQARERGHEVMLELPMEGLDFNPAEPGADRALKSNVSAAENIRNLDWLMSRATGYFAVTNYSGDQVVAQSDAMSPILAHLGDAGLGFVYDGSSSAHSMQSLAVSSNLPFNQAYNIIDSNTDIALIRSELGRLETVAKAGSPQLGIGFALPETLIAVKSWTASLEASGLELAPASYVLNR